MSYELPLCYMIKIKSKPKYLINKTHLILQINRRWKYKIYRSSLASL